MSHSTISYCSFIVIVIISFVEATLYSIVLDNQPSKSIRLYKYIQAIFVIIFVCYFCINFAAGDDIVFVSILTISYFFSIFNTRTIHQQREITFWLIVSFFVISYTRFYNNSSYLYVHFYFFIIIYFNIIIQIVFYAIFAVKSVYLNAPNSNQIRIKWPFIALWFVFRIPIFFLVLYLIFMLSLFYAMTQFIKVDRHRIPQVYAVPLVKFYKLSAKEPDKRHFPCIDRGWLCLPNYNPCEKGFNYYISKKTDWTHSCWDSLQKTISSIGYDQRYWLQKCFRAQGRGKNATVEMKIADKRTCRDRRYKVFTRKCFVDNQGIIQGFCHKADLTYDDIIEIQKQHALWKNDKKTRPSVPKNKERP